MNKMKAAYYEQYGPPSVISIKELPMPTPKDDEVLVKVKATTINRTDCGIRSGTYLIMKMITGLKAPKLKTPGTDFSGIVEAIGPEVTKFKVGDRVFGFDDEGIQSQAEYLSMSEKKTHHIPQQISLLDAVACLEGAHYAINFINKIKPKLGEKALVYGSTGAIGSAAVQLLKAEGLHVTAVCDTPHIEKIKDLGPDRVIDYKVTEYWKENVTYDYVLDAVGKSSFGQSKAVLSKKGIYVSSELGQRWENIYLSLITPFFLGKKVVFPLPLNIGRSVRHMTKLIEQGKFKPLIDRIYSLDEIVEAYSYVEEGYKVGNVIIEY